MQEVDAAFRVLDGIEGHVGPGMGQPQVPGCAGRQDAKNVKGYSDNYSYYDTL